MTILQNWSEIIESFGESASEIYKKTAPYTQLNKPIIQTLCYIWSKYPKSVLVNPYARGFGRGICSRVGEPVPPIPAPSFLGGQCSGVFYDVYLHTTRPDFDGTLIADVTTIPNRRGKIKSVNMTNVNTPSGNWYFVLDYEPLDGNTPYYGIVPGYGGSTPILTRIELVRVDGNPDNCGNPPAEYPPDPVRQPPDFTRNYTYNIYNTQGDVINQVNGDLNLDINSNLTFPITINVSGIKFIIDYDGIKLPPPPPGNKPEPNDDDPNTIVITEPPEVAVKKTFNDILLYVTLDVTQKPTNAKTQWGAGAPDVYYCGWFEFLINGQAVNRQPVHFISNVFIAPDNANGYAYTLYVGFKGKAKAYLERKIIPPEGLPKIIPVE